MENNMPQLNDLESDIKRELEEYRSRNSNWFLRLFRWDTWGNRNLTRVNRALAIFAEQKEEERIPLNRVMGELICGNVSSLRRAFSNDYLTKTDPVEYNNAGMAMIGRLWNSIVDANESDLHESFFNYGYETIAWRTRPSSILGLSLAIFWKSIGFDKLTDLFQKFMGGYESKDRSFQKKANKQLKKLLSEQVIGELGFRGGNLHGSYTPPVFSDFPSEYNPLLMTNILDGIEKLDPWNQLEILAPVLNWIENYKKLSRKSYSEQINNFLECRKEGITRMEAIKSAIQLTKPLPEHYTKTWKALSLLNSMGVRIEDYTDDIDFISAFSSKDALYAMFYIDSNSDFIKKMREKFIDLLCNPQLAATSSATTSNSLLDRLCRPGDNDEPGLLAAFIKDDDNQYKRSDIVKDKRANTLFGLLNDHPTIQDRLICALLPKQYQDQALAASSSSTHNGLAAWYDNWVKSPPPTLTAPTKLLIKYYFKTLTLALNTASNKTTALESLINNLWFVMVNYQNDNSSFNEYIDVALKAFIQILNNKDEVQFMTGKGLLLGEIISNYIKNIIIPGKAINLPDAILSVLTILSRYPNIHPISSQMFDVDGVYPAFIDNISGLDPVNKQGVLSAFANKEICSDELFKRLLIGKGARLFYEAKILNLTEVVERAKKCELVKIETDYKFTIVTQALHYNNPKQPQPLKPQQENSLNLNHKAGPTTSNG